MMVLSTLLMLSQVVSPGSMSLEQRSKVHQWLTWQRGWCMLAHIDNVFMPLMLRYSFDEKMSCLLTKTNKVHVFDKS